MKIEALLANPGEWLSSGGDHHPIVISSRVRLARNLAKMPFPGWAKKSERIRILEEIKPEVDVLPDMSNSISHQLNELSAKEKPLLVYLHSRTLHHPAQRTATAP